jgi:hypothetical protein
LSNIYFKLAKWNDLLNCWRDGKRRYASEVEARAGAMDAGRYRISSVTAEGRTDFEPFNVAGNYSTGANVPKLHSQAATRPMSGRPH